MNAQQILEGDLEVVAEIRIRVRRNGAMSVEGPVEDVAWMLACLENAKDAVRSHKFHRAPIVGVPPKDVVLPGRSARSD